MNLTHLRDLPVRELIPGLRGRMVHSAHMTIAHWEFAADTPLPMHQHPHEQIINVITGNFELTVDGEIARLGPGDVVVVPGGVPHGGKALTVSYVIDVFHPVREDYR